MTIAPLHSGRAERAGEGAAGGRCRLGVGDVEVEGSPVRADGDRQEQADPTRPRGREAGVTGAWRLGDDAAGFADEEADRGLEEARRQRGLLDPADVVGIDLGGVSGSSASPAAATRARAGSTPANGPKRTRKA